MILSNAQKAVTIWFRSPILLASILFADLVFFIVYGFVTGPVRDKILEHVIIIGSLMSQSAQVTGAQAVQQGQSAIALFAQVPAIRPYLGNLFWLFVLLSLGSFVTYALVQGAAWYIAHRVAGDKLSWQEFISRFALLNIWWGIAFFLYSMLSLMFQMRAAVINVVAFTPQANVLGGALMVMGIIVGILATWTYARTMQVRSAKSLVAGVKWTVKQWKRTLPATLAVVIIFVALNYAILGLTQLNPAVGLIAGVIFVFPAFAWTRLFLILEAKHGMDA